MTTMRLLLAHEAFVCFRGRWFFIALTIATGFGIAAAIESAHIAIVWHALDDFYRSNYLSFSNWMVVNCNARVLPSAFFRVIPLLASIPFAWSYHSERISGYEYQVAVRVPRFQRMLAKAAVTFASGFIVTASALLLNMLVLAAILPSAVPLYEEYNIIGVFTESLFSELFYRFPIVYVCVYTMLDSCLMGLWAVFVLGCSCILSNRVSVMVLPYLGLLGWQYLNTWLCLMFDISAPSFNLIDDMQGTFYFVKSELILVALQIALMLGFSVISCRLLSNRDVT